MATRPLSPHLTIWKWGPGMLVSILHRISGDGLALVGLPVLLWWLGALASGPEAYATFTGWVWDGDDADGFQSFANLLGLAALVVTTWALFEHTLSGLRHFVLDAGAGYEVDANNRWSVVTTVGGIVLTAAFWAALVLL